MHDKELMIIGIAADHGGFELKEQLLAKLNSAGYMVKDFGAWELADDDDYPDFVVPLAKAVSESEITRGLAVCGSGVGACVAANKVSGVRAALISDSFSAHQGVEDDDMNVMCLGGRVTGSALAWEPEPGNPMEVEGVLNPAAFRGPPMGNSICFHGMLRKATIRAAELLTMLCSPRALTGGTTLVNPTALMCITVWSTAVLAWHDLICRMFYHRKEWPICRMIKYNLYYFCFLTKLDFIPVIADLKQ